LNREAFMEPTDAVARYRRFLKRRNYSTHTVKNYINILGYFSVWLQVPIGFLATGARFLLTIDGP